MHGQGHDLKRVLFREAPQTLCLAIEKNKEEVLAKNSKKNLSVISGQPRRQVVAYTMGDHRLEVVNWQIFSQRRQVTVAFTTGRRNLRDGWLSHSCLIFCSLFLSSSSFSTLSP